MSYNSVSYRNWIATHDLGTLKKTLSFESKRTPCTGPHDGILYADEEVLQRITDLKIVIAMKEKEEAARNVLEPSRTSDRYS
jgi:hypothetical protein